jgi:hypothetical protein
VSIASTKEQQDAVMAGVFVGSIRRQKPDIGDIEIVAPCPQGIDSTWATKAWIADPFFTVLNGVLHNAAPLPQNTGLFGSSEQIMPPKNARKIATAVRGCKPGFKAATITLHAWKNTPRALDVSLQVFRGFPGQMGWLTLDRTGPVEFGKWFLSQWKRRHGIPLRDENWRGSIDGWLVDRTQQPVKLFTEEEAFDMCGIAYIPPQERDRFMEGR